MPSDSVSTVALDASLSGSRAKLAKALDDMGKRDTALVRRRGGPWFACPRAKAENLEWDTEGPPVSPELADAADHSLGDMNLPTDIVMMRLPEGGYMIRIFEIECRLESMDHMPDAAKYVMERMDAVRKTRDGAEAALRRRLTSRRALETAYGGLRLTRGVNLPDDIRANVEGLAGLIEAVLEDN